MNETKRLFNYAVLLHKYETRDGKKEYVNSDIIIQPTTILAKNEKEVVFKVTRLIPEEHATDPDNVELLIRGF